MFSRPLGPYGNSVRLGYFGTGTKRRHPTKGKGWVWAKYYRTVPSQGSTFTAPRKNPDASWGNLDLYRTSSLPIRRHAKVRAEATAA